MEHGKVPEQRATLLRRMRPKAPMSFVLYDINSTLLNKLYPMIDNMYNFDDYHGRVVMPVLVGSVHYTTSTNMFSLCHPFDILNIDGMWDLNPESPSAHKISGGNSDGTRRPAYVFRSEKLQHYNTPEGHVEKVEHWMKLAHQQTRGYRALYHPDRLMDACRVLPQLINSMALNLYELCDMMGVNSRTILVNFHGLLNGGNLLHEQLVSPTMHPKTMALTEERLKLFSELGLNAVEVGRVLTPLGGAHDPTTDYKFHPYYDTQRVSLFNNMLHISSGWTQLLGRHPQAGKRQHMGRPPRADFIMNDEYTKRIRRDTLNSRAKTFKIGQTHARNASPNHTQHLWRFSDDPIHLTDEVVYPVGPERPVYYHMHNERLVRALNDDEITYIEVSRLLRVSPFTLSNHLATLVYYAQLVTNKRTKTNSDTIVHNPDPKFDWDGDGLTIDNMDFVHHSDFYKEYASRYTDQITYLKDRTTVELLQFYKAYFDNRERHQLLVQKMYGGDAIKPYCFADYQSLYLDKVAEGAKLELVADRKIYRDLFNF